MVEWKTWSWLFSCSSWSIRFWINSLTSLSIRTGTSNFTDSGKFGVFETTFGGGKFKLSSTLGIFLGSGVTSVSECLKARLLDSDGVGQKLKRVGTAPSFSLNLVLGRIHPWTARVIYIFRRRQKTTLLEMFKTKSGIFSNVLSKITLS